METGWSEELYELLETSILGHWSLRCLLCPP